MTFKSNKCAYSSCSVIFTFTNPANNVNSHSKYHGNEWQDKLAIVLTNIISICYVYNWAF